MVYQRGYENINGGNVASHLKKFIFGTPTYNIEFISRLSLNEVMQLACMFYYKATHSSAPTPSQLNMG